MLVELDTVVVFVVEGSVVFVNCLIVALDVVEGLGEVVKVGLLLELDGLTEDARSVLLDAPSVMSLSSFFSEA